MMYDEVWISNINPDDIQDIVPRQSELPHLPNPFDMDKNLVADIRGALSPLWILSDVMDDIDVPLPPDLGEFIKKQVALCQEVKPIIIDKLKQVDKLLLKTITDDSENIENK